MFTSHCAICGQGKEHFRKRHSEKAKNEIGRFDFLQLFWRCRRFPHVVEAYVEAGALANQIAMPPELLFEEQGVGGVDPVGALDRVLSEERGEVGGSDLPSVQKQIWGEGLEILWIKEA